MNTNPPSFRIPFESQISALPPEHQLVIRTQWNSITDLQQAIPILKSQLDAVKSTATATAATVTKTASTPTQTIVQQIVANQGYLNNQSGQTSYQTRQSDYGGFVLINSTSAIAVTLAQTNSLPGIQVPWFATLINAGTSLATLTPVSGTINGTASFSLTGGFATTVVFDGSNFFAIPLIVVPQNTPAIPHEWLASYDSTTGAFTQTQPAIADVLGLAAALALLAPIASPTFTGVVTEPAPPVLTSATTSTSATAGSASALPSLPLGFLQTSINGVVVKVPYYSV